MMRISGDTLAGVNKQLAQRTDILVLGRKHTDRRRLGQVVLPAAGSPLGTVMQLAVQAVLALKLIADRNTLRDEFADSILVKIGVGDGGEQAVGDKPARIPICAPHRLTGNRDPLQHIQQRIVQCRHLRILAAYARVHTSTISGCFLTLITKHAHFSFGILIVSSDSAHREPTPSALT